MEGGDKGLSVNLGGAEEGGEEGKEGKKKPNTQRNQLTVDCECVCAKNRKKNFKTQKEQKTVVYF